MGKVRFTVDKNKLQNTLNTCDLVKFQEFEKKDNSNISKEIQAYLEKELENEMRELNYLK